jgi:hypothetical protein
MEQDSFSMGGAFGAPAQTKKLCRNEPFCNRPGCQFAHPSRGGADSVRFSSSDDD